MAPLSCRLPGDPFPAVTHTHQAAGSVHSPVHQQYQPPAGNHAHKPKVPDPPTFSGKNKNEFAGWLVKMQHKLRSDTDYYDVVDPLAAIAYVASRLEDNALESVLPRLPDNGSPNAFKTVREMLEVLSSYFSVYNRELLARQEYATLK